MMDDDLEGDRFETNASKIDLTNIFKLLEHSE